MKNQFLDENKIPFVIASIDEGMEEYLEHVGEAMVEQIQMGFDKGEDALGRPWEPLQDPDGGDILVDSGTMRDSIDYGIDQKEMNVFVGADVDYIAAHEFGVPDQNLPRRPILQPAAIWAEDKLIVDGMDTTLGDAIDRVI